MRKPGIFMLAGMVLSTSAAFSRADGDARLEYHFKGGDRVFYRVTEKIEDDKGTSVTVAYVGFEPRAYRSELELTYAASMATRPMAAGGVMPEVPPNPNLFEHDWKSRVTIDHLGKVQGNESRQDTSLPGAIAQNWQIMLPELGDKGQSSWQSTRTIAVVSRGGVGPVGPRFGRMPMQNGGATKANIKTNYTLHTGPEENAPTADFTISLDTEGNGNFSEHATGSGSFVFDTNLGLVQSLNEKLDANVSLAGKDEHATITVDVQLLEKEQVDRLIADAKARTDELQKLKDRVAARTDKSKAGAVGTDDDKTEKDHQWIEKLEFPSGTAPTDFVGHPRGGSPFIKAGDGTRPMIGLKYRIGSWGHPVIGSVEPLYEKPDDMHPKNETIVLARDGYVVGGFWTNAPDGTTALRIIFMKKTETGVDVKDAYVSEWINKPTGEDRIKLGCTGQWVVGLFGRQGMNTDAFGLVMKSAAGAKTADPTDDPNYAGTNVPAKPAGK